MSIGLFLVAVVATGAIAPAAPGAQAPETRAVPVQSFAPPADGRLSVAQVRMYLSVRRAARNPATPPGRRDAPAALADQLAGKIEEEMSAARRLGVDLDEYRWIRARVTEAAARPGQPDDGAVLALIDRQARAGTASLQQQAKVAPADAQSVSAVSAEAIAANRALLKKYQAELDALSKRR